MNDPISIKGLPWFLKIIAAVIGAIFALTLSGDIDMEGRIKITKGVIIKFTISVAISLYGGAAYIEYYQLSHYSHPAQGAVMLVFAVFGLLFIGIIYQSIRLMEGKKPSELIAEVKSAFVAIFK
ncbi:hypothetical protein MMO38_00455 [Acinetobacter sp. NIPH 1852]|uniref:hypothetical protein n=1 Tax=Acinetobacter sp. NIPH 1852 TaxID=2923428 RepID=UPI001F4B21ED|nr:hypothetical protein [Acinetobacter sp. NIPH 1852]MCH7306618.1 hypothetical protein [Acinetobacter sp. NIPH 1852]